MLAADVHHDLAWSAAAFTGLVWPRIRAACGGGDLVAIETTGGSVPLVLKKLDVFAGIDYLQVAPDGVLFGIAARVQEIEPERRSFDTFTVRRARYSGARTELAKRSAALDQLHHHPIWPRWTVQAYVTAVTPRRLVAAAVIRTVALFAHIATGRQGEDWWVNGTGNAAFICVAWDAIPSHWAPFIWRAEVVG